MNAEQMLQQVFGMMMQQNQTKQAAFNTATLLHGQGGIMSGAGLDQAVLSTHVKPRGFGSILPAFPSIDINPQYASITGISDEQGSNPTNPCDDAPTGYIKGCNLTARFGRVFTDTETVEMERSLLRLHRGDFMDLQMYGNMLNPENSGMLYPQNMTGEDILDLVTKAAMVVAGVLMERKLSRMVWNGSIANNLSDSGYAEFPGLDNQIATGQVDAETNTVCPSLDSLVVNANYQTLGSAAFDITGLLEEAEYFIYDLAENTLNGAEWVIVMRPNMWQQLTEVWPVSYNTRNSALAANNSRIIIDGRENITQRDQMRRGMTLDLNGRTYPVVTDSSIVESNNQNDANVPAGSFASSIYFVPLRINGGLPVTFWQYVDYSLFGPQAALLNGKPNFWTDGGRFSWAYEENKWCFKLGLRTSPRIVLRTPQLAFRIDNIMFDQAFHPRDPQPTSPYWVDGGVSLRTPGTQYAVWM